MGIADHDWRAIESGLQTAAHLIAALQRRMAEKGQEGLTPLQMERALDGISDALPGIDASDYDV